MQPVLADRPAVPLIGRAPVAQPSGDRRIVLALQTGSGPAVLAENLRRVAAEPRLLAQLRRIVVIDQGDEPVAAVALAALGPAGRPLLRLVEQHDLGAAGGLARALREALAEPAADAVLLLADGAVLEPAAVLAPLAAVRADDAVDVVAWHPADDPAAGTGALLPLDAVKAIGLAHAALGAGAVADLVLRADAAGFRVLRPAGGVEAGRAAAPTVRDRVLLAMLHEPAAARRRTLVAGLAADAAALRGLRYGEVAARHRDLAAVLVAPASDQAAAVAAGSDARPSGPAALPQGLLLHLDLWRDWSALRRRVRAAAFDLAASEAWQARFDGAEAEAADTLPAGGRGATAGRPERLRWRLWPTTRRATSAA